jgi:hypothetical protein
MSDDLALVIECFNDFIVPADEASFVIDRASRQHDPGTAKFAQPLVHSEPDAVVESVGLQHKPERYVAGAAHVAVRHMVGHPAE